MYSQDINCVGCKQDLRFISVTSVCIRYYIWLFCRPMQYYTRYADKKVMLYTRGSQQFLAPIDHLRPLYYILWTPQFNNMLLKLLNVDPPEVPWTPVGNPCFIPYTAYGCTVFFARTVPVRYYVVLYMR